MAKFSGKTTVENFEREFFKTFEMLCDVLKDGKPAVDSARLSSLRSKDFSGDKEGVFEAAGNMQVGNAKKRFEEAFGLQLEIYRTEPAPSDVTLASLRLDRGRRNPPKGELSASGRMSVEKFEEAFEDAFWVSAKVVDKGNPADPKTRLASLRTDDFDGPKAAELTIRGNMKVGNVIAALKENLGIVVVALALAPADNRTTLASLRAIGVPSIKPDEKIVVGKRLEEFSGHKYLFMFEQPEEVEYYLDDIFENDSEKSDALEQALDAVKALFEKFQQAAVEARFDEGDQVFLPLKDGENIKLIAVLDIFDGSFELEKIYFKFSSVTCIFLTQGNDDWDYNFLKLNESMGIDFSVVGPHPEFDEMVFQRYEDGYYDEGILSASDDEKDLFCGIRRFSDFYFSLLNSRASSEDFSLLNSRASSEENPDELKAVIDERGGGEEGGENDPTFSILSQEIKRLVDTQIVVDLKNEMPRLTDGRFKDVFCEVNVYPKLEDDGFGSETKNLFVQVTFFVAADSKIDSFDTLSRMTLTELFFSDPDMCEEISKELRFWEKLNTDVCLGFIEEMSFETFSTDEYSGLELELDFDSCERRNFADSVVEARGESILHKRQSLCVSYKEIEEFTYENAESQIPILIAGMAGALGVKDIDPDKLERGDSLYALMGCNNVLTTSLEKSITLHFDILDGAGRLITVGNAIDFAKNMLS